jgi:aminomethyltransferase
MKKTSLFDEHVALGGRMVEFAGYQLALQYSGPIDEHLAVRTAVGLFDVSHMGEFTVKGPGALDLVQHITCNDASKLAIGQIQYSALLTEKGTFVDDLLVYRKGEQDFYLVVNAANCAKDWAWVASHNKFGAKAENISESVSQIAIQGPRAQELLQPLVETDLAAMKYYWFAVTKVMGVEALVSRTGYTGEDGFEVYGSHAEAPKLWCELIQRGAPLGVKPCGLVARDTLRLESKMALYGNDIDDAHTALEADLGWIVKMAKGDDFIGRAALEKQKAEGVKRTLKGFEMAEPGIARHGYPVFLDGAEVGPVTSGSPAPFLKKNIGLTYLPADKCAEGTEIAVGVRGRKLKAKVVPTPFYKRPKK